MDAIGERARFGAAAVFAALAVLCVLAAAAIAALVHPVAWSAAAAVIGLLGYAAFSRRALRLWQGTESSCLHSPPCWAANGDGGEIRDARSFFRRSSGLLFRPRRRIGFVKDRDVNRRAALAIGAGAVAALAGFGMLAALPGLSAGLRVALAAGGYVSFVWIFRAALARWRPDWDLVWSATRQVPRADRGLIDSEGSRGSPPDWRRADGRRARRNFDPGNPFGSAAPTARGEPSSEGSS